MLKSPPMVIIYTKTGCPYCAAAKEYHVSKGVEFIEVNLSVESRRIPEIVKLTGKRIVPVIVEDDSKVTRGWQGGG
jgi:glutaredoxin 3